MSKGFLLSIAFLFAVLTVKSQETGVIKKDTVTRVASPATPNSKIDTLKPKYVNPGKIAGRRAMIRSAMLPGLGQIRNGFTFYRGLKVAGIYTGATLLTISYIDNNNNYHIFLKELQFRANNNGQSAAGSQYATISTDGLTRAKNTYKRNKQVVIFSMGGLYLLNIVEAYIDARLKYFDVGDVAVKFSPTMINSNTTAMYGFHTPAPGLKMTLSF